jgi:phenylacetate-CoA ligase
MPIYQRFVRDVLQPLSLWRAGETVQLRYQRELERTQFFTAEQVRSLQFQRLRTLLAQAYNRCPFYRERFDAAGFRPDDLSSLEDLRVLPPLEKRDIQEQGGRMISEGWPQDDLLPNQTGGSTGTPIRFFLNRDRKCSRAAATLRHNRWAGWEPGDRVAVIWGAPQDRPADGLRARLRARLLREPLWLDTATLTEQRMEEFHAALLRWRPKVIQAYARSAALFARFLRERGLKAYQPQSLVTSAEMLEADDRRLLEVVFGCPVFDRYGCREVSVIASECPAHTGLHINAECLLVEIESPVGVSAPGEVGAILITDLLNTTMPLIRYRIGDLGSLAEGECPCGRGLPRLAALHGRSTDFLVGSDGRLVSGVFLATYVVAHRPSLGQVQIRQDRAGAVLYRVRPGNDFDAVADLDYLRDATRRHLGDRAEADAELVDALPAEPSGKFLFSRSTVTPGFLAGAGRGP